MTIEVRKLIGTTTSGNGGAVTVTDTLSFNAMLYAVEWVDGDLADSNTAVLSATGTESGVDYTLLTLGAGEGDEDVIYYPRVLAQDLAADDLASTYAYPVVNGTLKLVIASGGDGKTGGCHVYLLV